MHGLLQLILLQANGYKALAAIHGDSSRSFALDLREKIARVGEGNLDVTVDFTNGNDQIGIFGLSFNQMVEQLREGRDEIDRLHRSQISRAEHLATVAELVAGLAHESATEPQVSRVGSKSLAVTCLQLARHVL